MSPFLKIEVTKAILSLSGKTPCCKEILSKCFVVEITLLETALTIYDEIALNPGNLLDFKQKMLYKIHYLILSFLKLVSYIFKKIHTICLCSCEH